MGELGASGMPLQGVRTPGNSTLSGRREEALSDGGGISRRDNGESVCHNETACSMLDQNPKAVSVL